MSEQSSKLPEPPSENSGTQPPAPASTETTVSLSKVSPTAYHRNVLECLKLHYTDLWDWFADHSRRPEAADAERVDLLKAAIRLDRDSSAELYSVVDSLAQQMGLHATFTIYQAQHAVGLNASMFCLPGEGHLVFHGPVLDLLDSEQLAALVAHELAHFELNNLNGGSFEIAEQVLLALATDAAADNPQLRTLRSYRLYTELYCDRRAAEVTGDFSACVAALVKLETGLKQVSVQSYIKQADEVLEAAAAQNTSVESSGTTHPEMYIRAKALQMWTVNPGNVDDLVRPFVEGQWNLQQLDIMRQRLLCEATLEFLNAFLKPKWLRTNIMLGHLARFESATVSAASTATELMKLWLEECDESIRSYFCYLLLDFVTCDADLEEAPLAAAWLFAENMGLGEEFQQQCAAELKLGKRALEKVFREAADIVLLAEKEFAE